MKRWQLALGTAFNVRPSEGEALSLLVVQSFFMGLCVVFFETAANALFFSTFDVDMLPYAYLAIAPVATATGALYGRCERLLTPLWLMRATLLFVWVSVLLFAAGYYLVPERWYFALLMVWKDVLWMMLGLEFWSFAGCIFNLRQGKRLFAVAASGSLVGGLAAGLLVGGLLKLASTGGLLVAAAVAAALTLAMGFYLTGRYADRLDVPEEEEDGGGESLIAMFRRPYLRLLFSVTAVSLLGYYALDYAFYAGVESQFPSEAELAAFFGYFAAVGSLVNLLTSSLLSGRLITRWGVGLALFLLPAAVLLGSAAASASTLLGPPALLFFGLLVGTKLVDDVLRDSIEEPTLRVLYQPLPTRERISVQGKRESMVEPIGAGFCGLLLLGFASLTSISANHLMLALIPLCAIWIALNSRLRAAYTEALAVALSKRRLRQATDVPSDPESRAIIERGARSPQPSEAIYCLRLLDDHPGLDAFLLESVEHPHSEVRTYALERIEARRPAGAVSRLQGRLAGETSPVVRGCLARTLCTLAEDDSVERLLPQLHDSDVEVRRGAMVGFLRSGRVDGLQAVDAALKRLVESRDPVERIFVAEVLAQAQTGSFDEVLLPLLTDEDEDVRRSAARAAGRLSSPGLLPPLVSLLMDASLRQTATTALADFGEGALPALEQALGESARDHDASARLLHVVGQIGGAGAYDVLSGQLGSPSWEVQSATYRALSRTGLRARAADSARIESCVLREAARAAWCWGAVEDVGELRDAEIIRSALQGDIRRCEDNVLLLLSLLHPATPIQAARRGLRSESSDSRAHALEILDSLMGAAIRTSVVALFEDIGDSSRRERLEKHFPQTGASVSDRLSEIISVDSPVGLWSRACALYLIGKNAVAPLVRNVELHLDDPAAVIRETARWASARL